jgi:hypothetical protein
MQAMTELHFQLTWGRVIADSIFGKKSITVPICPTVCHEAANPRGVSPHDLRKMAPFSIVLVRNSTWRTGGRALLAIATIEVSHLVVVPPTGRRTRCGWRSIM